MRVNSYLDTGSMARMLEGFSIIRPGGFPEAETETGFQCSGFIEGGLSREREERKPDSKWKELHEDGVSAAA